MFTVHKLSKHYGIQPILKDISFSVSTGDRIGLVGPNGCGKTTLMRILVGDENADQGTIAHTDADLRIGYLAQGMEFDPEETIRGRIDVRELVTHWVEDVPGAARSRDDPQLAEHDEPGRADRHRGSVP